MLETWSEIYSNSAVWRTVVLFAHIGGLLLGGGAAVSADRLTLVSETGDARQLRTLAAVHRVVLSGLAAMIVSGLLMLGADFETFIRSPWFWTKMALIVLLLGNGVRVLRAEQAARAGEPSGWPRLRQAAVVSLVLWFLITLVGTVLPNV